MSEHEDCAGVARWAGMFSQAVDNGNELARELRLDLQACQATMQTVAVALRTEADDIGMNDPTTADFLNKWADRLWNEVAER